MAPNTDTTIPKTSRRKALGTLRCRPSSILCLSLALPLLAGCNIRAVAGLDMYNQGKVKTYRQSDFFEDKLSARPLVAGTVARREVYVDRSSVGLDYEKAQYVGDAFPPDFLGAGDAIDGEKLAARLKRGEVVYNTYCAVCHGQTGKADGMIVQRGFGKPPSFVVPPEFDPDRKALESDAYRWARTQFLQTAPPRHVYNAISHGWGGMYSYGERVKPDDRWAVAAYIKALQGSPAERPVPTERRVTAGPGPGTPEHAPTGQPAAK